MFNTSCKKINIKFDNVDIEEDLEEDINGSEDENKSNKDDDKESNPSRLRQVSVGNLDDATLKARIATMGKG